VAVVPSGTPMAFYLIFILLIGLKLVGRNHVEAGNSINVRNIDSNSDPT